jgi:acyl carrier protein
MEEAGATVLVYSADVADAEQMSAVIREVKQQFGTIHGVINAAGVVGDGIIELRTAEKLREVLAPKMQGTLILEALLKDEPLDFFILCSSLTAFFGAAGQMDYTAANAFLDAFAVSRRKSTKNPPISINWDRWNEVGMAVRAVTGKTADRGSDIPAPNTEVFHHNVFSRYSIDGATETFGGHMSPSDHWIVGEHRINGVPALVGTAYLELARTAFAHRFPGEQVELRDVVFSSPLMIPDGERREVELILKASGDQFEFKIRSRKDKSQWQEHAIGIVRHSSDPEPGDLCDIPALLEGFGLRAEDLDANQSPLQLDEKHIVQAGRRWHSLMSVAQGHNEGVAVLQLPAEYAPDLADFELHPALLDAATSFALTWAAKGGVYLPCSYDNVKIRKSLTQKIYCYARYTPARSPQDELLSFDIEIFGEDGESLVEIKGYSCKVVRPAKLNEFNGSAGDESLLSSAAEAQNGDESPFKPGEWGILSKEGIEIFLRVLSLTGIPQVAIASVDLNRLATEVRSAAAQVKLETTTSSFASAAIHPRPNLPTPYVAPRTELEQSIAEVWQSVLGISKVGIHDNFPDLGGHSLMAVQLVSKIREMFNIELPIARFYDNPTVVGLAEAVVQAMVVEIDGEIVTQALQEINDVPLQAEEPVRAALSS